MTMTLGDTDNCKQTITSVQVKILLKFDSFLLKHLSFQAKIKRKDNRKERIMQNISRDHHHRLFFKTNNEIN